MYEIGEHTRGYSIGVYNSETLDKTKVHKMMKDKRIKYYVPADYSEGTEMDTLIKQIIVKTAANEKLEEAYYEYKKETCEAEKRSNEEEAQKMELMIKENAVKGLLILPITSLTSSAVQISRKKHTKRQKHPKSPLKTSGQL